MDLFGKNVLTWINNSQEQLCNTSCQLEASTALNATLTSAACPAVGRDGAPTGQVCW
jgi:hypothetical protein